MALLSEKILTRHGLRESRIKRVDLPKIVNVFMDGKYKLRELISQFVELGTSIRRTRSLRPARSVGASSASPNSLPRPAARATTDLAPLASLNNRFSAAPSCPTLLYMRLSYSFYDEWTTMP